MSRLGRSQPIQPIVSHGFVGNTPANGVLPQRPTVVENDDRKRRRYEPLPVYVGKSVYATVTAPTFVAPPQPTFTPVQGRPVQTPLPVVLRQALPVVSTSITTVIGELVLGAVAPTVSIGGSVTTVIGDLTLGAVAPTTTFSGSVTTTAAVLTLGASAPAVTFTGSITTVIGELILGAPLASTTGGSSGAVRRRSSFSHVTISLLKDR